MCVLIRPLWPGAGQQCSVHSIYPARQRQQATATSNGNGQLNLAPSAGRGFGAIERTKFRGQECKRLYFGFLAFLELNYGV